MNTAEQIAGSVNINKVLHPDGSTSAAERAWHYFLASLNSGYMYYGTSMDMEVKPTIACNEACQHADGVIGDGSLDATPPTIWLPQRHPWNPGSLNFGPQYGYQQYQSNGDFWVWSFVYDVSGVTSVTFKYRTDVDGTNPLASTQNETYAGGAEVGVWQDLPMTHRVFPAGNYLNDPSIDFFEMPTYIADEYYVQVTGLRSVLIDYYVEAMDGKGVIARSPIQHVYIGSGSGGGEVVTITPDPAEAGQSVTVAYDPTGRSLQGATQVLLHYGFNQWNPVISPDPPMSWNAGEGVWEIAVPVLSSATQLDMVFRNEAGTWDNNNGADWHFPVSGGEPQPTSWQMDGQLDADATLVATNNGLHLFAGMKGDVLYVACEDAGEGNDHFILLAQTPGALRAAPWGKAGQVADWAAFLADENDNDYEGWFDAAATVQAASGGGSGYLEGTINLREEFGTLPDRVYLAMAPYPTADGTALLFAYQVPASLNDNGNVEAGEYASFDTVRKGDCTGDWRVTLDDVPCFVDVLLGLDSTPRHVDASDMNDSGTADGLDVQPFVAALLAP